MARKLADTGLQNLPACAADFIKLVIKKMRYRRKVRAEVMAELTAHFEDELKDCTTDEQKQQSAEQLIAEFGDAKLLAVLLRRAKKRCRPLWRTITARTFQAAGILILCFIVYTAWFLSGKPVVTTNYVAELNHITRPIADESLNAAPLYEKAIELYEKPSDEINKLVGTKYNKATDEQKQLIRKWLDDNEQILELVIAGTQKPYYWQNYESQNANEVLAVLPPHFAEFRTFAYALRWRAWLRAEQGRYEDALDDMKSCYRLGQHLKGDKFLIEQLVGIAVEAVAVHTIRDILDSHEINSTVLARLQKDFEQITTSEDFAMSMKTEKLSIYDEIQRCFTEDRLTGGHLYLKRFQGIGLEFPHKEKVWAELLHILFTHPNKQESREMADRFCAFIDKMAGKTPGQMHIEEFDPEKEAMTIIKGNMLLEFLTPALWKVSKLGHRVKMDVEATLTLIAILRYGQDTGIYPKSLEALVTAGYLKELPMDIYSDKPLVYRKTDGDFTLYSIGSNFKDDGGERGKDKKGRVRLWADDGDAVFWPIR